MDNITIPEKSHQYEILLRTFKTLPLLSSKHKLVTKPSTPSESLFQVSQLLPMLSKERSSDHNSWKTIGSILYNVSYGSKDGIEAWIAFSNSSDTFTIDDCCKEWIDMKSSFHSIRILYYYVTIDNIDSYMTHKNTTCKKKLSELLRINEYELIELDCAELLYILYNDVFFYDDTWYECTNGSWNTTKECNELQTYIPKLRELIDQELKTLDTKLGVIQNQRRDMEEKEENCKEIIESEYEMKTKISTLKQTRKQICRTSFKNNIMKECRLLFMDKSALQYIDFITKLYVENKIEYSTETDCNNILVDEVCSYKESATFIKNDKIDNNMVYIEEKMSEIKWKTSNKYKRINKIIQECNLINSIIISKTLKQYFKNKGVTVDDDIKNGHKVYIEY